MNIFKVEADVKECQSLVFDTDDYLDVLDPHIGEKQAMFLPLVNMSVADYWTPLEFSYFHNEGTVLLADVSVWKTGILLLNEKAYSALHRLLEGNGEFLPCGLHGKPAYLFNCLCLKSEADANFTYRSRNGWKQTVESIEFPAEWGDPLFKLKNELTFDLFSSFAFKQAYEDANLKGLRFV